MNCRLTAFLHTRFLPFFWGGGNSQARQYLHHGKRHIQIRRLRIGIKRLTAHSRGRGRQALPQPGATSAAGKLRPVQSLSPCLLLQFLIMVPNQCSRGLQVRDGIDLPHRHLAKELSGHSLIPKHRRQSIKHFRRNMFCQDVCRIILCGDLPDNNLLMLHQLLYECVCNE